MPSPKRSPARLTPAKDPAPADDTEHMADAEAEADADADADGRMSLIRRSLPTIRVSLTGAVAAGLVILVAVGSWLFLSRPTGRSPIELTSFGEILSAARSGIVDVTSFDYLTLERDFAEIDEVTTEELGAEIVGTLEDRREALVTDQQVASTGVIAASLTEAGAAQATALIVLQARQKSLLSPQETVTRYRLEVRLELVDGRWLLSGLTSR